MLPFLKQRKESGIAMPITVHLGDKPSPLLECARSLIQAVENKDEKAVAEALRTVFNQLLSEPDDSVSSKE